MAIVRKFTNDFVMVPNGIINNPDLSLKSKGLWAYLASKPETWAFSVKGSVKQSSNGADSITSGMHELESFGYLRRVAIKNEEGQWSGYDYHIYDTPQEFTDHENTDQGKSVNGEPPNPSNIHLSNTDLSNKEGVSDSQKKPGGNTEKLHRKTLFKNSGITIEDFLEHFKMHLDQGVNVAGYYESIMDWSNIKDTKRTKLGWYSTFRSWLSSDKKKNKVQMIDTSKSDSDSIKFLDI